MVNLCPQKPGAQEMFACAGNGKECSLMKTRQTNMAAESKEKEVGERP